MLKAIVSVVASSLYTTALHPLVQSSRIRRVAIAGILCGLTASSMPAQRSAEPARQPSQADPAKKIAVARDHGKLPLSFEANRGQTDPQVRFLSRGNGYSLFLTDSAAVLSLRKPDASSSAKPSALKTDIVRMELSGASRSLHVAGDSQLPDTANYFIGNDPAKWQSAVPTYARVRYDQVYPGVDLVYYGNQSQLEYDFVVAPNADPRSIKLHFSGASKLTLDKNGDLQVIAKNGKIAFHKPVVYQQIFGHRQEIEGRFSVTAKNTVNFILGVYDHSREVVIDPTLSYSTYLGGSTGSQATGVAVDSSGSVYITGETVDADFPDTSGSFQNVNNAEAGLPNVFITKLNPSGSELVFRPILVVAEISRVAARVM